MHTEHRHSYGVIPVIGTPEAYRILLINQRDSTLPEYWTLPKGTPEEGESPRETAIRETFEEVGVTCDPIDEEFTFTDTYSFEADGALIQKSVTYFVGRALSEALSLQEKEVRDARWCTPEEARSLMTFKDKTGIFEALEKSALLQRILIP